ncbi:MAG TPA: hypothetical protein VMS17_29115 [Gemmataceae bacterium]|nr:hypothetical protein [Gemmataceae bacterium]
MFLRWFCRSCIVLHSSLLAMALAAGIASAAVGDSFKGDAQKIDDITVTPLSIDAKTLLPCLFWDGDKGDAFIAMDANGVIRRISYPDFKVLQEKDLQRKAAWLCPSAEGLVMTVPDKQEVWLLDAFTFDVKSKIDAPGVERAVSAPTSSVAAGSAKNKVGISGGNLLCIDLKQGKTTSFERADFGAGPVGFLNPAMTPDGKYVLTQGGYCICRFQVADGKFKYEESSSGTFTGAPRIGVEVSPDSKWCCLPSGGAYVTLVYSVTSLAKPECSLEQGPHPIAVGFDPAGGWICTHTPGHVLALFTPSGVKKKEYAFDKKGHDVFQYLAHPDGNKLLLLQSDKLYAVELPKQP